jgi:hypothetical protein
MESIDEQTIQTALNCYNNLKKAQKKYQQKNKEKMNNIAKAYYYRLKEDPERYKEYLEKTNERQRKYYHEKKAKKTEQESANE